MLSKFFGALAGTIAIVLVFIVIAVIGVAVMFVGYFLLWGFIGLCVIAFIWFLISALIDELRS